MSDILSCSVKWHLIDICCIVVMYSMSHIVESCPLTKLNGRLSRQHSVDEDAVSRLTSYGSWHAYEKKKNVLRRNLFLAFLFNNYDDDCILQTLFCSKSDAIMCVDCLWEPCLVIAYSYYKCTCFYPLYIVCISVCLAASLANKGVHNHTAVSRVVWHNCDSHFTGCKRRISYNRDDEQCVNLRQNYKTPKMNFLTISDSKNCTIASSFIY